LFRLRRKRRIHLLLSRRRQTPLGRLITSVEGGGTPHPAFAFGKIHLLLKGKAALRVACYRPAFSTFRFQLST
ncbi:MAG: hypothetical protein IJA70_07315, partial [Oscillospiraceae bacterium]|nr:hypothetical protein [Oscillospiraceae bacterium]